MWRLKYVCLFFWDLNTNLPLYCLTNNWRNLSCCVSSIIGRIFKCYCAQVVKFPSRSANGRFDYANWKMMGFIANLYANCNPDR